MATVSNSEDPVGGLARVGQTVRSLRATLGNPLDGLPRGIFREPIVRQKLLGRELVYVMDPTLIHEALVSHSDDLDKGEIMQRLLRPALGNGLLTAEGEDWRWQRRAIAPLFRAKGLERFLPAMRLAAEQARDRLVAVEADRPIAVNVEMMRVTFDIIVETMLSGPEAIDVDATAAAVTEYLHNTRWSNLVSVLGLPEWMPHPGKRQARAAADRLRRQLTSTVVQRRHMGSVRDDLVDILLLAADPETGRRMTDAEITDNLLTFLTAGHETTALGLAWTLDLLGRHPEIARRVHEEAVSIGSENSDGLVYTKQVFQEALRLYPAAPLIVRRVIRPFTLGGAHMAPGTVIMIPIHAVHRHEALWDAPHVFDPERFAPTTARPIARFAYMPFGAGPRVCVGVGFAMQEAAVILLVLLRDLRFTSVQERPPEARMEITLRPVQPLLMRISRRPLH